MAVRLHNQGGHGRAHHYRRVPGGDVVDVDVQVQLGGGLPAINIVGLADGIEILAPSGLLDLINHFKGSQLLNAPEPAEA